MTPSKYAKYEWRYNVIMDEWRAFLSQDTHPGAQEGPYKAIGDVRIPWAVFKGWMRSRGFGEVRMRTFYEAMVLYYRLPQVDASALDKERARRVDVVGHELHGIVDRAVNRISDGEG